jgi:hypothetical protein
MRGDLLALKVALAPPVIGYAEMATRPASRPDAHAATNPYRVWIAEYAGAPCQEVAAKARTHPEDLADHYATPARESELIVIGKPPGSKPTSGKWAGVRISILNTHWPRTESGSLRTCVAIISLPR